ncbi:MAG TPA: sigma-70 family RNA polymerase sigma factor [Bryobacteraceae bacterium]|nr:sigma-70 family RNA polymerase sigma factor [Bryobacteraceae bacterium]
MIQAVAAGEFAALVKEHQSMVFSMAYHYLHDRALAEEVAQDVFLQLHRSLGSLESPAHAANWLRKVAVHRSIDAARRRKLRPQVSLEDVPELSTPASPGDPVLSDKLRQLVASLPEKARMVVVLRYQEDLGPDEIARVMGIPCGTVKSQLQRALAMLREKAERMLGEIA